MKKKKTRLLRPAAPSGSVPMLPTMAAAVQYLRPAACCRAHKGSRAALACVYDGHCGLQQNGEHGWQQQREYPDVQRPGRLSLWGRRLPCSWSEPVPFSVAGSAAAAEHRLCCSWPAAAGREGCCCRVYHCPDCCPLLLLQLWGCAQPLQVTDRRRHLSAQPACHWLCMACRVL